ncbi:MAG: helix-turn-helix domain-containing protein [Halohasta sp.]
MRFIAELRLGHPELVLTPTIRRCPGMEVRLESQLIGTDGEYILLFHVRGAAFEEFEAALAADPTVADATTVITTPEFRIYRMRLVSAAYLVFASGVEMGLRLLEAVASDGGWYAVFELPNSETLLRFRDHCMAMGVDVETHKLYRIDAGSTSEAFGLTSAQREAITTAYEAGYFNQPRDTSLQGVADRLGVSSSAAGGRLRRGLGTLVEATLYDRLREYHPVRGHRDI